MRWFLIGLTFLLSATWSSPEADAAGNCLDYQAYVHFLGTGDTPGRAFGVDVEGTLACVADGEHGVSIFNVSDASAPLLLARIDTPGDARAVAISGDHVCVADRDGGLAVLDIADPTAPYIAGSVLLADLAEDVVISGSLAYVAAGCLGGLTVVNISNPAAPSILAVRPVTGYAEGIAVSGNLAFLAVGPTSPQAEVAIYNVSIPSSPVKLSGYVFGFSVPDVAVQGRYAFVANGIRGLKVLDVLNPAAPVLVSTRDTPGYAASVAVSGDYAYVADGLLLGLQAIDVTNVSNPVIVGQQASEQAFDVALGQGAGAGVAWIADDYSGLRGVDIAPPITPAAIGVMSVPALGTDIVAAPDFICMIEDGTGSRFRVINASDPAHPVTVGSLAAGGQGVARSGALALIASGGTTLSVVDLTTPAAPSIVGTLWTPDYVSSAAFLDDGRHAIVTCATFSYPNILCVDLTVPSAPAIVGRTAIPGLSLPFDAVIRGSYAYVGVQGAHGLSVVNVSNPASPVEVSQVIVNWQAGAIAREDHYVYLAGDSLLVLDVTVPANPVRIGVVDLPWPVARATASQGMVYVSAAGGVMIVDVTDPANPVARGQRSTPGAALGVDADSEYVFLAHIAILSSERRFTILPRQCSAVTTVEAGMPGAATPGLAADPNPFREMVSLHIDAVGGPGGVIEIFDARGRRVRSLSRAAGAPAGTPLTWDGRDATGAAVASGVYFARLEWGGRSAITRLILAR